MKKAEYIVRLTQIIDEFDLKLTKKQMAEKMAERYGGNVKSHYWRIARLKDGELNIRK
jgi:hypothetical protein